MQVKRLNKIVPILLTAQILISGAGILKNHPNEFAYFNFLAGSNAEEKYEMDYWNVSSLECLLKLVSQEDTSETLKVAAYEDCAEEGIRKAMRFLPGDYINQLEFIELSRREEADYLVANPSYQHRSDLTWELLGEGLEPIDLSDMEPVFAVESYGRKIMSVYRWIR